MTTRTDPADYYHAGSIWRYHDARGVEHVGHLQNASDFGGTDVPYTFKDCATGELSIVSGSRLKSASVEYAHVCAIWDRIRAELQNGDTIPRY